MHHTHAACISTCTPTVQQPSHHPDDLVILTVLWELQPGAQHAAVQQTHITFYKQMAPAAAVGGWQQNQISNSHNHQAAHAATGWQCHNTTWPPADSGIQNQPKGADVQHDVHGKQVMSAADSADSGCMSCENSWYSTNSHRSCHCCRACWRGSCTCCCCWCCCRKALCLCGNAAHQLPRRSCCTP